MTRVLNTRVLLRTVAVAVAIAGAVDPVFTVTRRTKPEISVVASSRLPDPRLVDRVEAALRERFTVVRDASFGAAAIVSVGYQLPDSGLDGTQPAFAVLPEPMSPFAAIASVHVPARAHLQSRVPVSVTVHTVAAKGRKATVKLAAGDVTIDQVTRDILTNDGTESVELSYVATATGTATLQVGVTVDGAAPAIEDVRTEITDGRLAVLFFDRRPSWMSTFVRRAAEADPRLAVTSRVGTSKGVATTAGRPPDELSLPLLDLFQVVVAGAPEELTAADAAGLERFMRGGGAVVLLFDQPAPAPPNRPVDRLIGPVQWTSTVRADPTGNPLASEILTPARLPPWGQRYDAAVSQAVWHTPVGSGRLFISGALDAWRYRDRDDAAFDAFWRGVVAEAGASADSRGIKARTRAPTPGTPDERGLIAAWVASRKGIVVGESQIGQLPDALERRLDRPEQMHAVRPMRSAWWILPLALALGGEWWLRRRSGTR